MYCKNCGKKLDDDAIFCTKCGSHKDSMITYFYCEKCGSIFNKDAAFCTECGTPIPEKILENRKKVVQEEQENLKKQDKKTIKLFLGILITVTIFCILDIIGFISGKFY
ncbi:MAG: zinc ribbon domain-containing protein [Spirochaetaceae bacterium]|nr:zinc ribbon domain-containing protein [Spirochaetaceae bacterium]